jgi:phospholipid/cholesterol/gamma-HCH transport system substrate-binding protein
VRWVSRLVTAALAIALLVAIVVVVVIQVRPSGPTGGFRTSAAFRDASRLPVGSRVMVAGVHVGKITGLTVDGRLGRVDMTLSGDVELWDDAWAEKKAESLFGDGYIEIHPGAPGPGRRRLVSGEPIPRVVDEVSTDRTLRELEQAMPAVEGALGDAEGFLTDLRQDVNGPVADRLARWDRAVATSELSLAIGDADDAMTRFEEGTTAAADALDGQAPRVHRAIDGAARDVAGLTADLRQGRQDLQEALGSARARMDEVDPYLEDAAEVVARLDGRVPPEEQGTAGRLINDPELGNTIADGAEAGRELTNSLTRLETFVGLRAEYGILNRQSRVYVGAKISGRSDNFFVLEAGKFEAGDLPDVALSDAPNDPRYVRTAVIRDELRLTAQWGRRFDWLAFRFGLKESSFGVGADAMLLGDRLELTSDLLLPTFERVPYVKISAALQVFRSIFLVAGLDDALLDGHQLAILPGSDDVPQQLRELRYGRDPFVGVFLRFDDEDLNQLLLLYGAVIFAAL